MAEKRGHKYEDLSPVFGSGAIGSVGWRHAASVALVLGAVCFFVGMIVGWGLAVRS